MDTMREYRQDAEYKAANVTEPVQEGVEVVVDAVPAPARELAEGVGDMTEATVDAVPAPPRKLAEAVGAVTETIAETLAHGAKAAVHVPGQAASIAKTGFGVAKGAAEHVGHAGGKFVEQTVKRTVGKARDTQARAEREARHAAELAAISSRKAEAKLAKRAARAAAKHRASEERAVKSVKQIEKQLASRLKSQEAAIHNLELKVSALSKRRVKKGGGGGLIWLVALVGGGYYLARNPQVRVKIREAVSKVSPQAASYLESASRQVRNLIGEVWIERDETTDPPNAPKA